MTHRSRMARPADQNAKIELLRAAEQVFVEHGLEHARVEEITARAGRSKGSFYLHFDSKEDAFREIVESLVARMASFLDAMGPSPSATDGAPLVELLASWHAQEVELFEFLWQNRRVMRLVLRGGGSAHFGYLVDAFAERARSKSESWLLYGVAQGLYRPDLDTEVASVCISGAYDRLARRLVELDKRPDIPAWLHSVQQVVLLGLVHPDGRGALEAAARAHQAAIPDPPVSGAFPATDPGASASTTRSLRGRGVHKQARSSR